jgi:hypothetical protein
MPIEYAIALFCRAFYGWSYREAAAILDIPKSMLHWAFQRLPLEWVRAMIARTAARLRREHETACSIIDSTGVSWQPSGCKRHFERRPYGQLHALVEYSPKAHAVWFADAIATASPKGDAPLGERLLTSEYAPPPTVLLADKGYDSFSLYRLAYKLGWRVCMRQRKNCEWNRGLRGRVLDEYDDDLYRAWRGRVEAPFGGFARRYKSTVNERLAGTRKTACLLWAVAHNVRTIARTLLSRIYRTVSPAAYLLRT